MEHETHFGPHHYEVNTYVSDDVGKFVRVDSYMTTCEYPGFDDASRLAVIEGEMTTVRQHLAGKNR